MADINGTMADNHIYIYIYITFLASSVKQPNHHIYHACNIPN
jgi:hypothetical protein